MDELTDAEFSALVAHADDLRRRCAGRLPHTVSLKFNSFVLGTASFTWQERGIYLGLLYRQFDKGYLPTDVAQLASVVSMEVQQFTTLWQTKLAEKFRNSGDRLYNKTMLEEWNAQASYLLGKRKSKAEQPAERDPFR